MSASAGPAFLTPSIPFLSLLLLPSLASISHRLLLVRVCVCVGFCWSRIPHPALSLTPPPSCPMLRRLLPVRVCVRVGFRWSRIPHPVHSPPRSLSCSFPLLFIVASAYAGEGVRTHTLPSSLSYSSPLLPQFRIGFCQGGCACVSALLVPHSPSRSLSYSSPLLSNVASASAGEGVRVCRFPLVPHSLPRPFPSPLCLLILAPFVQCCIGFCR